MAIRVALNHRTSYRYAKPVMLSPHVVRLRPAPHCRTPIHSYSIKVKPGEHFLNWQQDPYSNRLARLVFPKPTRELTVEIDLVAEMTVINPFDFFLDKDAEHYPFGYDEVLTKELTPYFDTTGPGSGPRVAAYVESARKLVAEKPMRTVDFLVEVNRRVWKDIRYVIRLEPGIQKPEETLELGSGSCRDSTWLMVQVLRRLGLAARFVSGYLIQLTPDVKSLDGPSGTDKDFTDLHAWCEVYLPGAGWVGIDATSGLMAGEGHIPLACSAEPVSASPITGFFAEIEAGGGQQIEEEPPADSTPFSDDEKDGFEFSMKVTRIHEDPRVTKPYTDAQWAEIEALGHKVDSDLRAGDVRLTMGGEPTFVSIDDMDGAEWNTAAVGPMKYRRGDELIRRLRDRFAGPGGGGFLHHGQGKWYPGESLPRWSLGLYWRKDGEPIWADPTLVADEREGKVYTEADARAFMTTLCRYLKVDPANAHEGFEDAFYYLWKERRLPVNVDPFDSKLDNKEDRERLAKVFEQGLDKVIGLALPLKRDYYIDGPPEWVSGKWFIRSERMYLIPGDSPMGYRLPLDSIPWALPGDRQSVYEQDAWEARGPLPRRGTGLGSERYLRGMAEPTTSGPGIMEQLLGPEGPRGPRPVRKPLAEPRREPPASLAPITGQSAPWVVRTALCVEPRGNALRVFMPPVRYLEDYLDLVEAIENTAAELKLPVLVEGYTPPYDPRVNVIKVTPDPGVIEVNTVPVGSWDELVRNTTALYEEARLTRLGTEKFNLDGKHTGTGGGNHIIVGGATPADSPLLRRPDLLRSLLGYWHNHPSLSYLFSSTFIGATSQAPRVDEARNDQVYELELAFSQVPDKGQQNIPPWLVDRIFRNILIDATGNTHRAEFCIDKLYSPDSPTGRLGLLEMRAFEMPPHAQMSLAQHLLLRALIARFWDEPYRQPLVRWGTEVHDRFLLPRFVRQDFDDVLEELSRGGGRGEYRFRPEWFDAHFEFRFPLYGSIEQRGVWVELRAAIEPWNVLGEESAAGGTARYVDSSVERLQVLVRGMTDPRHVLACNGVRVPLHPTGVNGEFVAGVRYRAWRPPSALHPTIGVHSPLVFDLYDKWAQRSIGGCQYSVVHPGGLSYDQFPVNAYAAETRRISRFLPFGHTPGGMQLLRDGTNAEFPFTLDLRRF